MGKARGLFRFLVLVMLLAISSASFGQGPASSCAKITAEVWNVSRATGVLRADPKANETASQKISSEAAAACPNLSDAAAFRQVRMKISDNNIILSGTVPNEGDEEQLIAIVTANADGRTVFNRLEVVPLQMAGKNVIRNP